MTTHLHALALLLGFAIQLVAWNIDEIAATRGRRHLVILGFAAALIVLATIALVGLPA